MKKPVVDYSKLRFSNITSPEYRHLLLLLGWVVYFAMYFITENLIPTSSCHLIHCVVDDWIPFCEYFVFFYVLWYIYLGFALVYFALYDVKSFVWLQKYLILTQVIAMITYCVYPSVQDLRPDLATYAHHNVFTWILSIIYAFDTPTGVFPSLHVAYSLGIASTWAKKKDAHPLTKAVMIFIAVMVSMSVNFVKQHSFLDVVYAFIMCIAIEFIVFYKPYWLPRREEKLKKRGKTMRHRGDRRDGKLIRDLDSMHYIMPLMYPNRCDNEAYMTVDIDIEKTEEFLKKLNEGLPVEERYSIFQVVIAAAMKTVWSRPQMNRFIANKNVYMRNDVTAAFTVKKELSDDGEESLARLQATPESTLSSIREQINEQINFCKNNDDQSTESMNFIQKLPFKHLIGAIARSLDRHGHMPQSVIATDPYQCSIVLSNLGSIGMNVGYHHLMNWGTTSIFIVMGKKKKVPVYSSDGTFVMKKIMKLSMTIDERISDGFYYGQSIRLLKRLIEHPEMLQEPFGPKPEK